MFGRLSGDSMPVVGRVTEHSYAREPALFVDAATRKGQRDDPRRELPLGVESSTLVRCARSLLKPGDCSSRWRSRRARAHRPTQERSHMWRALSESLERETATRQMARSIESSA